MPVRLAVLLKGALLAPGGDDRPAAGELQDPQVAGAPRPRGLGGEPEAGPPPDPRGDRAPNRAETPPHHNQGANPADFDYEFNLTYGAEWFRDDALLRRLRRLLDAETARHAGR